MDLNTISGWLVIAVLAVNAFVLFLLYNLEFDKRIKADTEIESLKHKLDYSRSRAQAFYDRTMDLKREVGHLTQLIQELRQQPAVAAAAQPKLSSGQIANPHPYAHFPPTWSSLLGKAPAWWPGATITGDTVTFGSPDSTGIHWIDEVKTPSQCASCSAVEQRSAEQPHCSSCGCGTTRNQPAAPEVADITKPTVLFPYNWSPYEHPLVTIQPAAQAVPNWQNAHQSEIPQPTVTDAVQTVPSWTYSYVHGYWPAVVPDAPTTEPKKDPGQIDDGNRGYCHQQTPSKEAIEYGKRHNLGPSQG